MLKFVSTESEYAKDRQLKVEDVKALLEWAEKQHHLPKILEIQAILFLQSCYYSNEKAKIALDNYFTVKTLCPEMFGDRDSLKNPVKDFLNVTTNLVLPKKTPEGYSVVLVRLIDFNPDSYVFNLANRTFDMATMLSLYQDGTSEGQILALDMHGIVFGHLTKLGPLSMKKILYYLQDAMPVRLKSLHFFNTVPFMDKIMALMRPFLRKETMDMLHLHPSVDGFLKFVPKEMMPQDYGGNEPSIAELHDIYRKKMMDNAEFFRWEDTLVVDESQRLGKPKNAGDFFGVEGTFKKLELD